MIISVPCKESDVYFSVADDFHERLHDFMDSLTSYEKVNRSTDFKYLLLKAEDEEIKNFLKELDVLEAQVSLSKFSTFRKITIKNLNK